MKYRIFISIVDISANLKNIDINKEIFENIDIDKESLENIDIDKILNRLEFGISNRAMVPPTHYFHLYPHQNPFQNQRPAGELQLQRA